MSIFGEEVGDLLNDNIASNVEVDNEQLFDDKPQEDEGNEEAGEGGVASGVSVKVQPKRRAVNPRPRLTVETLRGPRGLHTIEEYFKDIRFKGKGSEKDDLDEVLKRLQHWGHRMYPTYKFDDVLGNIERLGKKKELQVHMSRYRLNMLDSMKVHGEVIDAPDNDDDVQAATDEPFDEFDALLAEQIAISKIAPRTPVASTSKYGLASSTNNSIASSSFGTPSFSKVNAAMSTPYLGVNNLTDSRDLATPLPLSQPSTPVLKQQLTAEQKERIAENRRLAQERLAAKKLSHQQTQKSAELTNV